MMPEKCANLVCAVGGGGLERGNSQMRSWFESAGLFGQCAAQYQDRNKAKIIVQLCKIWRVSRFSET